MKKSNDEVAAEIEKHLNAIRDGAPASLKHEEEKLRHWLHVAQKRMRKAGELSDPPIHQDSGGFGEPKPDPEPGE